MKSFADRIGCESAPFFSRQIRIGVGTSGMIISPPGGKKERID
jgi:hypothetical protein